MRWFFQFIGSAIKSPINWKPPDYSESRRTVFSPLADEEEETFTSPPMYKYIYTYINIFTGQGGNAMVWKGENINCVLTNLKSRIFFLHILLCLRLVGVCWPLFGALPVAPFSSLANFLYCVELINLGYESLCISV